MSVSNTTVQKPKQIFFVGKQPSIILDKIFLIYFCSILKKKKTHSISWFFVKVYTKLHFLNSCFIEKPTRLDTRFLPKILLMLSINYFLCSVFPGGISNPDLYLKVFNITYVLEKKSMHSQNQCICNGNHHHYPILEHFSITQNSSLVAVQIPPLETQILTCFLSCLQNKFPFKTRAIAQQVKGFVTQA